MEMKPLKFYDTLEETEAAFHNDWLVAMYNLGALTHCPHCNVEVGLHMDATCLVWRMHHGDNNPPSKVWGKGLNDIVLELKSSIE